jgi:xanthine/uracil permease
VEIDWNMAIAIIVMITITPLENLRKKMINVLFLIPAIIAGYLVCYFVMTYKVKQD